MIYTAEKAVKDAGEKIPEEVKTAVEGKITALKEIKDKDDVDAIKKASEELSAEMQKIGEHMAEANKQQATDPEAGSADGAGNPQQGEEKAGENVKEAEFEEEKKKDEGGEESNSSSQNDQGKK